MTYGELKLAYAMLISVEIIWLIIVGFLLWTYEGVPLFPDMEQREVSTLNRIEAASYAWGPACWLGLCLVMIWLKPKGVFFLTVTRWVALCSVVLLNVVAGAWTVLSPDLDFIFQATLIGTAMLTFLLGLWTLAILSRGDY